MNWFGVRVVKNSQDLFAYQEMIWKVKPKRIIECGTRFGGSALFFAQILELMNIEDSLVITIDISNSENLAPPHKLVKNLIGSSLSPNVFDEVKSLIGNIEPVLVSLDSDHSAEHVSQEISLYYPLVTKGSYLVVEDTNQLGPRLAVYSFLATHPEFIPDKNIEPFSTTNPNGYLLKTY